MGVERGCLPSLSRVVSAKGGVCKGAWGVVSARGGVCPGGWCLPRWGGARCLPRGGVCLVCPGEGGVCPGGVSLVCPCGQNS